jgi:hypothetical protein
MSTTPRPPLLSDEDLQDEDRGVFGMEREEVRDFYEAARAKDAELIQQLVDGLQQIADEGHWTPDMHELLNAAAAAGFKPSET